MNSAIIQRNSEIVVMDGTANIISGRYGVSFVGGDRRYMYISRQEAEDTLSAYGYIRKYEEVTEDSYVAFYLKY